MLKISDSLRDIIKKQPMLLFGFKRRLFNLSRLADLLKPLIEIRTKKPVTKSAVLMNLSRLQDNFLKPVPEEESFKIDNLMVNSNLCTITFYNDENIQKKLVEVYNQSQKEKSYIVINQRPDQVSMILSESFLPKLSSLIKTKPKYIYKGLAALGVQFGGKYMTTPGMFHFLIQQLSLQGINIWEISSTYSELIFYIDQQDTSKAFETFNNLLAQKEEL